METKYNIVKKTILSRILDGTYQPHQKISSESELMKEFDVSRHTVRLAIGDLVNQGLLYREQGAGTFCADRSEKKDNKLNSKSIAIVTTYISDYIFPSIIRGAESYLSQHGYNVTLFSTNNNHEKERLLLETVLTQHFDGVIIEPTKSALPNPNINYYLNLERQSIPYIMINAYYDELEPISIIIDDEKGGYLQTEHLIKLGHKNIIGFFKNDDMQGTKRMKGYLKAHRTYNLSINPNNIITYYTDEKDITPTEELKNILSKSSSDFPTAMVCYNDELAVKLLDVLRENNIRVPDDMSVVGFDHSFLSNVSEVKLTTIEHPLSELGSRAGKMILEMVKEKNFEKKKSGENLTVESIVYEPKLIVQGSTMKLESQTKNNLV